MVSPSPGTDFAQNIQNMVLSLGLQM